MTRAQTLTFLLALATLYGCSTKPLYQRWNGGEGYRDSTLNLSLVRGQSGLLRVATDTASRDSTFQVEFYGSRLEEDAWTAAAYRVAEFTLEHGHEYFTIIHDTIVLTRDVAAATENKMIAGPRDVNARSGMGGRPDGAGGNSYGVQSQARPVSIKIFTVSSKPSGAAQNAREVLRQYATEIRRPSK